jgi:Uma2 family endonuclease
MNSTALRLLKRTSTESLNESYVPDVAFITKARMPELAKQGDNPVAPDLAVEVDFPSTLQSQDQLRRKLAAYMAAGTLLWIVRPESKTVEVYAPGRAAVIKGMDDVLDGGAVLPGFTLALSDIFAG